MQSFFPLETLRFFINSGFDEIGKATAKILNRSHENRKCSITLHDRI